ncbi:DUF2807 domain-containing protein [Emcibacteraceae bacterium]|jgi:hypothetical protein|uniref:head GIN domain-containing protein n=1 Tax=Pseudemcibacter sp. TaxID=2943293 RepID=UPI002314CC69|nr:DUF2807 domain-containing protein [Kordiimonadaceae bacterium]MDA7568675.1 DUF2807 domain-containing protein [Emcibacteraceae bacterium]MDA9770983.1 DUF2807 domain-containing protein [Emcibacteraceae bacterium]
MNKLFKIAGVSGAALTAALYASSVTETLAEDITKSSDLSGFTKVQLNTSSDVNIKMGSTYSIEMVGDEERIGNTVLEMKDDTLKIKHKKGRFNYDSDQDMEVFIVMPNIESMQINGSGDADIEGVDNSSLALNVNGSGDIFVKGQSEELDISINGSGNISMGEVMGKDVEISINGSGDVELDGGTCQSLEIDIHGSGDVEAKDMQCQDVNVEVAGSGDTEVYASNSLTFDSHGSGNVEVYGKPQTVIDHEAKRRSKIRIH